MPSNAKHMQDKYQKHADHSQLMHRDTLPMGVNDGGKEKKRKEKKGGS